ncbi:MAG: chloride channel protein [Bacteroidales bacterium]|nr:chloride channel protein [Bacteroidales bacterium]
MINSIINKLKSKVAGMPESKLLIILSLVVGLGSGIAAVLLKQMVHFVEWILTGWFNTPADSFLYLLYPGVGMLLALLFVKFIVKDNIGHGVTKVLLAVSKNESKIKSHNMWSSVAASSVTIGFGGSVGAEAPIVYTGAAIGSNVARALGLSYKNMTILLGCGAAGAVAGIFKAPMAGILFTFEILLFNMSMSSLLPFVMSSITATTVSYLFLGNTVAFENDLTPFSIGNLPFYILFGNICGYASLYFTRTTLWLEDKIKGIQGTTKRWLISAICLGLLIFIFPPLYGEGYGVLTSLLMNNSEEAVGTSFFTKILTVEWVVPLFFIGVFFFKVFTMSFTNAGGGVGGTFGPTLFMGGIVGFVVARLVNLSGIHVLPEANFVLVGMAGLMAGVMQAPLTAIFLIAEITGGYTLLMPLIITSAVSFATIRFYEPYSIYTKRIAKQGDLLTHDSDQAVLTLLKTDELIEKDFSTIGLEHTLGDLVKVIAHSHRNIFPVVDDNGLMQGIVYLDDVREIMFEREKYDTRIYSIMKQVPEFVYCKEKMESVMTKFEFTGAWNLPVVDQTGKYLGFVSKSKIFSAYREQLQQVSHD